MSSLNTLDMANARAVSSVVSLHEAFGQVKVLRGIFDSLDIEFNKMSNPITKTHAICCTGTNSVKTDSVKAYVAMAIKVNFNAHGNYLSAMTKESIARMSQETVDTIINRIACGSFSSHKEVFIVLASSLLGYDPFLIEAALTDDEETASKFIFTYVAGRFGFDEGYQPREVETTERKLVEGKWVDVPVTRTMNPLEVYISNYEDVIKTPLDKEKIAKLFDAALATKVEAEFNLLDEVARIS